MSVRSVFPHRAVFQSATPADRTSRRSSSIVRARAARACVCVHDDFDHSEFLSATNHYEPTSMSYEAIKYAA